MSLIPPDEYCLLWINWWATCLTKNEWASWVQAIGTVIAIAVALIAPYMHAKSLRRSAHVEQLKMLETVVEQAQALGEGAVQATTSHANMNGYMEFEFSAKRFERIAVLLDRLPHHTIQPPSLIAHILQTQASMEAIPHTVKWIADAMESAQSDPDEGIEHLRETNDRVVLARYAIVEAQGQRN